MSNIASIAHRIRPCRIPSLLLPMLAISCSQDAKVYEESLEQTAQSLAAYNTTLWNQNNYVVNFCWTTPGLGDLKSQIRDAVNRSWQANSGLTFNWPSNPATDVCPQSPENSGVVAATYMPLYLSNTAGWGGECTVGYGARKSAASCGGNVACQCSFSADIGDPNQLAFVLNTAIHEIGHGLGLPHEHQRIDRPESTPQTCVDPNNEPIRWTNNSNYTIDASFFLLTEYDGLKSIMSYCRDWDGNGQWDSPPFTEVSPLDALGIEMLYPKQYGRRPIIRGGITNADGSAYIVRTDVTLEFLVDWQEGGGLASAFHNPQWRGPGGFSSTLLNPASSVGTSGLYEVQVDDVLYRHHPWTGTTVVADSAQHTAIVMAANL